MSSRSGYRKPGDFINSVKEAVFISFQIRAILHSLKTIASAITSECLVEHVKMLPSSADSSKTSVPLTETVEQILHDSSAFCPEGFPS